MAISIDWPSGVISVPLADLTLVGPGAVYEHDLDAFRLSLKDLEDSEEGMPWPRTHNHNTVVTLGGVVYARTIEIINGYTVTYEDGAYAVRLVGANSNVEDVAVVNSVSIRSANSAGLVVVTAGVAADVIAEAVWQRVRALDTGSPGTYSATNEWASVLAPGDVADAVWDELRVDHTTSGTYGAVVQWAGVPPTVAALADAFLDELVSEHQLAGSLGATIQRLLDVIEADMSVTGGGTVLEIRRRSDNALLFNKIITGGNTIDVVVEGV